MLIGVGGFGGYHLAAINTLCQQGRIRLLAVADPAIEKMPQLKKELQDREVRLYSDYIQLLEHETNCTAVSIAAPIPFHFEIVKACIKRDLLIYLEKPPVPLLSQLETLVDLDMNHRVYVGFQYLCYPWMRQLKSWIIEGRFGEVSSLRASACWNRTDTYYQRSAWCGKMMFQDRPAFDGPATNALAHLIHSIMYLASPDPDGFSIPSEVRGELYRARRIESYDVASLCGRFDSGPEFSVAVTHATQFESPFGLSVSGTEGWAKISMNGARMETSFGETQEYIEPKEVLRNSYCGFMDFVEGQRQMPHTTLADCRGYTIATNGLLLSSGGIHDVPEEFTHIYQQNGKRGYSVEGLESAVMGTLEMGGTLSDMNFPWTVRTNAIPRERIAAEDLLACLRSHAPNHAPAETRELRQFELKEPLTHPA